MKKMKKMTKEQMMDFLSGVDNYLDIYRVDDVWLVTLLATEPNGRGVVGDRHEYKSGELPLHPIVESVISEFIDRGADRVFIRYDIVDIVIVVNGWSVVKLYNNALNDICGEKKQ